jgi:hypothetical protein
MREIGGAVGIAVVSTVLIGRTNDANELASPGAQQAAAVDAFQAAFVVIVVLAALGALVAFVAFPGGPRGLRARSGAEEVVVSAASAAD